MALKKPAFEQEPTTQAQGDTAVAEAAAAPAASTTAPAAAAPAAAAPAPAAAAPAAAAPVAGPAPIEVQAAAETAIAKASATSLSLNEAAAKAKSFAREVADMKGASDFSYGNYAVFKGNNGEIGGPDNVSMGRWAKVRLLSWDDHHEISPGEQGASSKDFVAYSKDGKVIDSVIGEEMKAWVGSSCEEYIKYLKEKEDFQNAKSRRFIDTACAVLATDSGDGPIGKIIQITLSESSIPAFAKHQQNLADTARCVSMGLPGFSLPEDPFTFYFIRELASKGNNKWTKLRIEMNLPAKI
jgi:hypothetical protein